MAATPELDESRAAVSVSGSSGSASADDEVSDEADPTVRPTVVVTGFGPFGAHSVNASWESVQLLPDTDLEKEMGVRLKIVHVPVEYQAVQDMVPRLWDTHHPILMVHVGVSSLAQALTLEQQACNRGYESPDVSLCLPAAGCCVADPDTPDMIVSSIDMGQVAQHVDCTDCGVVSCISRDPGRYLCEFIYYRSLSINRERTAFIHVPSLDGPYTARQLASGLKEAIKAMLMQLRGLELRDRS